MNEIVSRITTFLIGAVFGALVALMWFRHQFPTQVLQAAPALPLAAVSTPLAASMPLAPGTPDRKSTARLDLRKPGTPDKKVKLENPTSIPDDGVPGSVDPQYESMLPRLAVVEGDSGKGSAFVVNTADGPTLATNIHVLSGNTDVVFRSISAKPFSPKTLRLSRQYDLALVAQGDIKEAFDVMPEVENNVRIGDEVVVLGNSLGQGVVTSLPGKVVGVGPELIEIDAKFVSGNSGCPIIHKDSGKVIAIATYTTETKSIRQAARDKDSPIAEIRRFGYRLDTAKSWETIPWGQFKQEGQVLERMQSVTKKLFEVALDICDDGYVTTDRYQSPGDILRPFVTTFAAVIYSSHGVSAQDRLEAKQKFTRALKFETEKDWKSKRAEFDRYSSWHAKEIRKQIEIREDLYKFFEGVANIQDTQKKIHLP